MNYYLLDFLHVRVFENRHRMLSLSQNSVERQERMKDKNDIAIQGHAKGKKTRVFMRPHTGVLCLGPLGSRAS